MKPFPFLPVSDKKLTKTERKEERARIDQYYQNKLAELQKYIYESFGEFYAGKMNVFELDRIIHIYHKQSQELFSFITSYNSNDSLRFILAIIDAEERGEWSWQPKTRQEPTSIPPKIKEMWDEADEKKISMKEIVEKVKKVRSQVYNEEY